MSAEIKPGQIWVENDPRFPNSFKRVVNLQGNERDTITILSCDESGNTIINSHTGKAAPRRSVKTERFNGQKGGYSLHKDVA